MSSESEEHIDDLSIHIIYEDHGGLSLDDMETTGLDSQVLRDGAHSHSELCPPDPVQYQHLREKADLILYHIHGHWDSISMIVHG